MCAVRFGGKQPYAPEMAITVKSGHWRPMQTADLPSVTALAAVVHPGYPEDDAVFAERLRLYPQGCRVLERDGGLVAYVVSHPWQEGRPPKLNVLLGTLPAVPDTYYIHDIALLPVARGLGAAARVIDELVHQARAEKLASLSLVAVNGSSRFWERQGFEVDCAPANEQKLRSYGGDARLMVRKIRDDIV